MNKLYLALFCICVLQFSCKKQVQRQIEVYNNSFENSSLVGITNGKLGQFNNSKTLGRYSNEAFELAINNLPEHQLVTISFDLYIHDGWEGNMPAPNGPDIWEMKVNGNTYITASFSNGECIPGNICPPQSYPLNYPNNYNNPKSGATETALPGFCTSGNVPNVTTFYKIVKTFKHSDSALLLQCAGKLVIPSTSVCNESWSVDNITIKAITL